MSLMLADYLDLGYLFSQSDPLIAHLSLTSQPVDLVYSNSSIPPPSESKSG